MGEAMRSVGYSDSYSLKPDLLRKTDAWQELLNNELKDEKLVKKLNYLINHRQWRAVDAGLDKAFRLKKRYDNDFVIKHKLGYLTDSEIAREISEAISEIAIIAGGEEEA